MGIEREIAITIRAYDEFTAQMERFRSSLSTTSANAENGMQSMNGAIGKAVDGIKAKWLEIAGAIAATAWLRDAANQALEAEVAFNKLKLQVEFLGLSWNEQSASVERVVAVTSRYAIVQEEGVAKTLQSLIFNSGRYRESLTNLNLVYDLAYQKGVDASEAAMLVGKAMTGNVEMLGRYIPELRNLDTVLGANATAAQKAEYALLLLREKSEGALGAMTEHERSAKNATKAYEDFKETVGAVVLAIKDFLIATFNEAAGAGLYLYGAALKVVYGFTYVMNYLRGGELNNELQRLKLDIEAAFGAGSELMIKGGEQQARVLGMATEAVGQETSALKRNSESASVHAAQIKAENDAKLEAVAIDQKRILAIKALEAQAQRSSRLELAALDALSDKQRLTEDYYNEKMSIETKAYESASSAIEAEISLNRKLAQDKIANLDTEKRNKKEVDAINLEMFGRDLELTEKRKNLDNDYTINALKNFQELHDAQNRLFNERVTALGRLAELERNDPYQATPSNYQGKSEIVKTQETYQKKLDALQAYNTSVIQEMIASGASQDAIHAKYAEMSIGYSKAERDAKIAYAADSFGAAANFMQNLYIATGSKNKAMFETMKAFAIAQTVIDTYQGAQAAYKALSGIPYVGPALGVAAAAAAIAAGMARVAQIQATHPGGGSISAGGTATPSYFGGSPSAYPVPQSLDNQQQNGPTNLTIVIHNPLGNENWDQIVQDQVIPALNRAGDRRVQINANVVMNTGY